jgi:transposase
VREVTSRQSRAATTLSKFIASPKKKKYPYSNKKNKETSMSKYSVILNHEQRSMLEQIVKKGEAPARKIMHANILLKTDGGREGPRWSSTQIEEAFGIGSTVIKVVRKRYFENGMEDALERKPQPRRPSKLKIQGKQEAQIIAVLCTEQPEGQERWTLRALTDRIVELEIVEQISYETVRTVLKKMNLNLGKRSNGV